MLADSKKTSIAPADDLDPIRLHRQEIERLSWEDRRVNALNAAMLEPPNFTQKQGETDLEAQILRAIVTSKYPKKDLVQIARRYDTSIDEVELIAKKLAKERGLDLEQVEFAAMLRQVKEIEGIVDAGFREWKLQSAAKQYRRTRRELMEAYNKALIHQSAIVPLNLSELKKISAQSTDWTVQGWFPAGSVVLLHGHGGTAKTLMLYGVGAAISKGEPWNDYPTKQGEVLLLQSDEPTHVTQERLEMMGITDDDPFRIFPGWQVEKMPQLEEYLHNRAEAGSPVRFLIVDSNTSVNRNTLISENDVEYARPVLQLADLAQRFGTTIVIVHHSNSNGDARGTKAIHNSVSEVWALSIANESTGERLLRVQKNRLGRPPGRYSFDFDAETYAFTYKGEEGDYGAETATNEKRIELWMNEDSQKGVPYAVEEISHHLSIPRDSVRRALYELWSKGIVLRKKKDHGDGKGFLYHAGTVLLVPRIDRAESADRFADRFENNATQGLQTNRSIDRQKETSTNDQKSLKTVVFTDRLIDSPEKQMEPDSQIDRRIDRQIDQPIDLPKTPIDSPKVPIDSPIDSITDRFVAVGDLVAPNATSVWHRSGSDKLPWRDVPPSYRRKATFSISNLEGDLFFELTDVSRVIAIKGDRVQVRNQLTGRTTTYRLIDVSLLKKSSR